MVANGSIEVLCTGVGYEVEGELWQLVDGIGCVNCQLEVRGLEKQYSSYRAWGQRPLGTLSFHP